MRFIAVALPFTFIWTSSPDQLSQWCELKKNAENQHYLSCLLEYKGMLSANNTKYNVNSDHPETLHLLERVKALQVRKENHKLQAAVLNLQGLIERDILKDLDAANKTWAQALALRTQLQALSVASLLSNLAKVFTEQGKHIEAHQLQAEAVALIEPLSPLFEEPYEKQILATFFAGLGNCCRKIGDEHCFNAFQKAINFWPENMVFRNNMAIALSKINSDDPNGLLVAEELLEKKYLDAKSKNLFVTPYYRADVNIKLASYFKSESAKYAHHIKIATECLETAKAAIANNNDYKPEYQKRAQARIAKLEGDLQYALGQSEAAEAHYVKAIELRQSLGEPQEKKDKFIRKIPNTSLAFNPAALFRHPRKEKESVLPDFDLTITKSS
ncbi:MAG: tetratricopeptide repeat protein [Legionella sp.]